VNGAWGTLALVGATAVAGAAMGSGRGSFAKAVPQGALHRMPDGARWATNGHVAVREDYTHLVTQGKKDAPWITNLPSEFFSEFYNTHMNRAREERTNDEVVLINAKYGRLPMKAEGYLRTGSSALEPVVYLDKQGKPFAVVMPMRAGGPSEEYVQVTGAKVTPELNRAVESGLKVSAAISYGGNAPKPQPVKRPPPPPFEVPEECVFEIDGKRWLTDGFGMFREDYAHLHPLAKKRGKNIPWIGRLPVPDDFYERRGRSARAIEPSAFRNVYEVSTKGAREQNKSDEELVFNRYYVDLIQRASGVRRNGSAHKVPAVFLDPDGEPYMILMPFSYTSERGLGVEIVDVEGEPVSKQRYDGFSKNKSSSFVGYEGSRREQRMALRGQAQRESRAQAASKGARKRPKQKLQAVTAKRQQTRQQARQQAMYDLGYHLARFKREVLRDVKAGLIDPAKVKGLEDLSAYVDVNDYGGFTDDSYVLHQTDPMRDEALTAMVWDAVDTWIANGGLRGAR